MAGTVKAGRMFETDSHDEAIAPVAALFEQYHEVIFAYLVRLLNDAEWAHDLTQDVFLQVFRHRHKLPQIENERAWIYRIASNMAFTALKRQRRFSWLPWRQEADWHGYEAGLEKQVGEATAVTQALSQLPANYRAPLLLYGRYDFSVKEIAAVLDISEGAAKNRLWRAREMFRQAYGERDDA
jgi:RNA polymerase sigma-70 factor (ECF subfamily)